VRLLVGAGREEECIRRPVRRRPTAEGNRPEAVDYDWLQVCSHQEVDELEMPVLQHLIGKDAAVAEIADEQVPAELAEVVGGERDAPGRVQLSSCGDAPEEVPIRIESADEAETLTGNIVVSILVLFRVGHEDLRLVADLNGLNTERSKTILQLRIDEGPGLVDWSPIAVEHVDAAIVEIGSIEEFYRL
jgi:hypothetical protein